MPEQYKINERVRVLIEGAIVYERDGNDALAELTIALETSTGDLYDVTVPLDQVTIERLVPADGKPKPGEIWRDRHGTDRFATKDSQYAEIVLQDAAGAVRRWQYVNQHYGPLTRVYPAPAPLAVEQPEGGAV
ncbi:hypothetical protein [Streptosporangium sp. NPDC049078]|uniref:hypothetical protein n=1 Tax=Streptosporangium sp. NPDC049078 TaxID=3155767 RepID=UPI00341A7F3B